MMRRQPAIKRLISLAAEGAYSAEGGRQKQWSDHNYFFPELELSTTNKGSAVVAAPILKVKSSREPLSSNRFKPL
jgi:hypothetical protein